VDIGHIMAEEATLIIFWGGVGDIEVFFNR